MSFLKTKKVLHHPEKISEWYNTGDTAAPVTVKIDLTNVCNHNCPGCIDYELIANDNNSLDLNRLCGVLDDFKELDVKAVNYTGGGEPTVHKDFADIIRETHRRGIQIGLICNGSRFHKLPMEEILKMFTWIRVSMDSFSPETHIRTHGSTAKYDLTIDNLEYLVSIKREQNLNVTLGAGYITHQHADMDNECWRFIKQCKDVGLDYAQLRPSFGVLYDYDIMSFEEWEKIISRVKKYEDDKFSVYINEGKYKKIFSKNTCRNYDTCHAQAFKSTTITATGQVYMCCSLTSDPRGYIGNIKKRSFKEIWQGDIRKKALERLNVHKCPSLCVGDSLNEFLEQFKNQEIMHKNFL